MDSDAGGWLWLIIDVGLVAAFGIILAYGTVMYRRRDRSPEAERARDAATRRNFR